MNFQDRYSLTEGEVFQKLDEKGKVIEEIPKLVVSNDAYAIGDMIQKLIYELGRAR